MNVELGSNREAGENTLEVDCVSKMEKYMIPEQLLLTGNLPEQWARFKKQFKLFFDASEKSEASDKAKIAMLFNLLHNIYVYKIGHNYVLIAEILSFHLIYLIILSLKHSSCSIN